MARNEQLLCIDGSKDFRRYISRHLKSLGYKIIAAENKKEAHCRLRHSLVDPVLVVLGRNGEGGVIVARSWRRCQGPRGRLFIGSWR